MPACRICSDGRTRRMVDSGLLAGHAKAEIARRASVSRFQVIRHERHMQRAIAAGAKDSVELRYGTSLLEQIESINADLARLQGELEQGGDYRGAVAAVKTKLEALETAAKLSGQIQTGSRSLTLVSNNIDVIDEATAVKMARIYVERHSAVEGECTPRS